MRGRRVERLGSSNRRRAEFVCLHAGVRGRVQSARPVTVVCVDGRRTSIGDAGVQQGVQGAWAWSLGREAKAKGTARLFMSDSFPRYSLYGKFLPACCPHEKTSPDNFVLTTPTAAEPTL